MSDIIDSIIGFVTNPFGIFDSSSSKRGRMMALGDAPVPVNYPIFLQTDANGNISTFDFETQNFKALKISGDITSNGNLTVSGKCIAKEINATTNNPLGNTILNASDNKNYLTGETIVRGGKLYLDKQELMVKTDNPSGDTHLNSGGKNYLTGDTDFRGGAITILNDTIPGRFATHFPHTSSKENWISGPTNFRQGGIKVEAGQTISIGGTSINEDELSKLKTFINLRKSISSGNVKLKWDGYTNVFTLSQEAHNWGIFTIKSAYSMSQYKLWYIAGIVSSFELIQKTTGSTKVPNMNESIDVICDGAGNVTAKSTTTYPDCTWIYERYY